MYIEQNTIIFCLHILIILLSISYNWCALYYFIFRLKILAEVHGHMEYPVYVFSSWWPITGEMKYVTGEMKYRKIYRICLYMWKHFWRYPRWANRLLVFFCFYMNNSGGIGGFWWQIWSWLNLVNDGRNLSNKKVQKMQILGNVGTRYACKTCPIRFRASFYI